VLEIHRVVRRPIAIVYVVGYHFPAGEHIWLSINEDRGGRFTDCQGEEEWVRADRRGRVSARLLIPRCALHLCDAHTETLGATADYKCGLDCGRVDVTVFACPRDPHRASHGG